MGGFVEVLADRVIVLADTAERADEIDVARAQAARDRALKRMANPNDPTTDWPRAEEALERAQVRLQVAANRRTLTTAPLLSRGKQVDPAPLLPLRATRHPTCPPNPSERDNI